MISAQSSKICLLAFLIALKPTLFNCFTPSTVDLKLSKILTKSPLANVGSDIISAKIVPSESIVFQGKYVPSGNVTEYLPPLIRSSFKDLIIVLSTILASSTPAFLKPSVIKLPNLPNVVFVFVPI